ncbi:MAG: DUF2807 domain-containing protein [Bacteroidales bacterium]|nr:DUF2807 domain-containing protein [Bacteroidales bacterium]
MKTLKSITVKITIAIVIITSLNSCEGWDLKGIKGEGPIVSEQVQISDVEGIILEIPATVFLTQGDEQGIRIDAQQNILDNMFKSNDNGVFRLSFDKNVSRSEPIKVYMTIASLSEIDLRGSGEVVADTKFTTEGSLYINISGSGNVDVDADATDVDLNISGSGEIRLKSACVSIDGSISGSGDIILNGSSNQSDFNISGSGSISAYNFSTKICDVNTAGSGDAKVNVSDNLIVRIAGSGNVYYIGNPSINVNIAGSGSVINAN